VNAVTEISIGAATFVLALGVVLWTELGGAVFSAMMEVGYLLCQ